MTEFARRREEAALESDNDRHEFQRVACPECDAEPGKPCRDVHNGQPLGKLPAHWRRVKAALEAARVPVTAEQARWDQLWGDANDEGRRRGLTPNDAARRATHLTEARHGPRPQKEINK